MAISVWRAVWQRKGFQFVRKAHTIIFHFQLAATGCTINSNLRIPDAKQRLLWQPLSS
jgi:hypothetical protein